jgi:calcium permeable stress-gated cation channel
MDPALYQRDRGEADWDARSVNATTVLGDGSSNLSHSKSGFYTSTGGRDQPAGYDQYMQQGPHSRTGTPVGTGLAPGGYEMTRLGSEANLPLLASQSSTGHSANGSQYSLHDRSPSVGPGGGPGYFSSPVQGNPPYPAQERSGSSLGYHARASSTGFDQAIAPSAGAYHTRPGSAGFDQAVAQSTGAYPPQQQHYVDQGRAGYQQRSGSGMGYHQQSPSTGQYPPVNTNDLGAPSRYYTPSPTLRERGNDGNMAGRGANRYNY